MIKFSCNNCGRKIGVKDELAGKQGKCPGCHGLIVVPERTILIDFNCENCGQAISALSTRAGKEGKCPKCKLTLVIPGKQTPTTGAEQSNTMRPESPATNPAHDFALLDVPQEYKTQDQSVSQSDMLEEAIQQEQEFEEESAAEKDESDAGRRLPWIVDLFLYPISASGIIHLAILSFLPRMLLPLGHSSYWTHPPIFHLGFIILFIGYLLYCLFDCVRDSADGGRRAPDIEVSADVLLNVWELISPVLKAFVCTVVCLGPLLAYFIIAERTDTIFWLLAVYGVVFSPMVFLAVVLFDSFRALNPILIITSMFGISLPYCGLALLFFAVGSLIAVIMAAQPRSAFIGYIFSAACVYLAMVMAHLLGRFYCRYQEQINWEV